MNLIVEAGKRFKEIKRMGSLVIFKRLGPMPCGENRYFVVGPDAYIKPCKSLRAAEKVSGMNNKRLAGIGVAILGLWCLWVNFPAYAQPVIAVDEVTAIRAIVGEAEGEPYAGKLAVAYALRNRAKIAHYRRSGVFKGVYGLNRKILAPARVWREGARAWKASGSGVDITNGASVWGTDSDVRIFGGQPWFKRCIFTGKIGNHNFYRELK